MPNNFGDFLNNRLVEFQPIIVIYRRGNFVYHYWRFTSIYQLLSYPFRSLVNIPGMDDPGGPEDGTWFWDGFFRTGKLKNLKQTKKIIRFDDHVIENKVLIRWLNNFTYNIWIANLNLGKPKFSLLTICLNTCVIISF